MKHGKRLTREQKIFLDENGLNPSDYLRVKDLPEYYVFVHRTSGKTLQLPKGV